MLNIPITLSQVKEFQGVKISIIFLLWCLKQMLSVAQISSGTGYTQEEVTKGLKDLAELKIVFCRGQFWELDESRPRFQ